MNDIWDKCISVERNSAMLSGAWVSKGTRVPVSTLFENLEDGAKADEFIEWFPGVTAEQVKLVLEHAEHMLEAT